MYHNRHYYKMMEYVSEKLVVVRLESYMYPTVNQQLWHLCNTRKVHSCARCGTRINSREMAFRPLTNQNNRMHRLCIDCLDRMKHEMVIQ